ncbi:hypothetical protein [Niallia taxi]|uniref:CDP-glycerol:poly(Glycerophosphate) glycerophosphotransferase n=1 Tax=Niallia taxi TaxID=2499688 RepID=A0A437KCM6_9BACI|nr:hypothetical protein [Niallia taxi]RVT63737.1 hypothetical protein EM808_10775 [Niallia taxi]
MFLKKKQRVLELTDTIIEMVGILNQIQDPSQELSDCLMALDIIAEQLMQEEELSPLLIEQFNTVQSSFVMYYENLKELTGDNLSETLAQLISLVSLIKDTINTKLNIVFFPYKVSMWDSLSTVYEAAKNDENCVVNVVPIPYYQLAQDKAIPTYEGDRFPEDVKITHFDDYKLEEQEPDIIFIHNIYDNYNTLTRVYDEYFTSNLKKYTDMLVYVPYYTASFIPYKKGGFYPYHSPAIDNIDKFILAHNKEKEIALEEGIQEDKLLVLGSPKLDIMYRSLNSKHEYPEEWKEKLDGKTVYVLNTGCMYFAVNPFVALEKLIDIFNIPRFVENSVILWRPHPLTEISILKYTPYFSGYFSNLLDNGINGNDPLYKGIILDKTDDYMNALLLADVLITTDSSILRSYLLTEKKVLFWDEKAPKDSLVPENAFYYAYSKSEPWYELVKKFPEGYDPLEQNRIGVGSQVYVNSDGTSGEKIFREIKAALQGRRS